MNETQIQSDIHASACQTSSSVASVSSCKNSPSPAPPELIILTEAQTRANAEKLYPSHQRPTCPIRARAWDTEKQNHISARLQIEKDRADFLNWSATYALEQNLDHQTIVLNGQARRAYTQWQDSLRAPAHDTIEQVLALADEFWPQENRPTHSDDAYFWNRQRNEFIEQGRQKIQTWQHALAAEKQNLRRRRREESLTSSSQLEPKAECQPEHEAEQEPEHHPEQTQSPFDSQHPMPSEEEIIKQLEQPGLTPFLNDFRILKHRLLSQNPATPDDQLKTILTYLLKSFLQKMEPPPSADQSGQPDPDALPAIQQIQASLNQTKQPRSHLDRLSPTRQARLYEELTRHHTRDVLAAVSAPKEQGGWALETSLGGLSNFRHRYEARLHELENQKLQQQIDHLNSPDAPNHTQAAEKLLEHRLIQTLQTKNSTPEQIQKIVSATTRYINSQTSRQRLDLQKEKSRRRGDESLTNSAQNESTPTNASTASTPSSEMPNENCSMLTAQSPHPIPSSSCESCQSCTSCLEKLQPAAPCEAPQLTTQNSPLTTPCPSPEKAIP